MIQILMMVGHLGPLYLSSTALAVSLAAVTGFSLLLGMAGALETISGQSYGAQQYKKLGTQTYTAIFSLTLFSIPLSVIWIYIGDILVFLGQDPAISHEAGKFMTYLVPTLVCYAVYEPLVRYFQSQSLVMPMFLLALQSLWKCSMELEFFRYAIPSAAMVCLEWWSFELLILISGFLPNPEFETSVLSVCLTTISTLFAIPYGISAAASTRISNELGAGNPQAARIAAYGSVVMGVANGLTCSSVLFATRRVFGYCFSNEKQVIDYVTTMAPLVCVNVISDSMQVVLSGVARGCGWQRICSYVNLAAYYLVGIPVAAALGFWNQMRGRGLWMGIMVGALTQSVLMSIITSRANWEEEVGLANTCFSIAISDLKILSCLHVLIVLLYHSLTLIVENSYFEVAIVVIITI
ncbi:protein DETOXIFICATION 12-like [Chenopodium quinoa]|uniref:protein DETOXIFICATION 12-like n=1 Tax=Chenopodium quinoa TaxID=63459 RepID=UPI000B783BEC|nr:protein DETOXIFICATION 12-like [Chenopodium quinoa]